MKKLIQVRDQECADLCLLEFDDEVTDFAVVEAKVQQFFDEGLNDEIEFDEFFKAEGLAVYRIYCEHEIFVNI